MKNKNNKEKDQPKSKLDEFIKKDEVNVLNSEQGEKVKGGISVSLKDSGSKPTVDSFSQTGG